MSTDEMTIEQVRRNGLAALLRDLGAQGTMQFLELVSGGGHRYASFIKDVGIGELIDILQEFTPMEGDYTRDRQAWLPIAEADPSLARFRNPSEEKRRSEANGAHQPAEVNLQTLYDELSLAAVRHEVITNRELSEFYEERSGHLIAPQAWSDPLAALNSKLHEREFPPISAVVVQYAALEPYDGFWGSAPSVPSQPDSDEERILEYRRILQRVHETKWPAKLPGADEESR